MMLPANAPPDNGSVMVPRPVKTLSTGSPRAGLRWRHCLSKLRMNPMNRDPANRSSAANRSRRPQVHFGYGSLTGDPAKALPCPAWALVPDASHAEPASIRTSLSIGFIHNFTKGTGPFLLNLWSEQFAAMERSLEEGFPRFV